MWYWRHHTRKVKPLKIKRFLRVFSFTTYFTAESVGKSEISAAIKKLIKI